MADRTDTTLGLTQLARTWSRRLGQADPASTHDALVVLQGPAELVGLRFPLDRRARQITLTRAPLDPTRPAGKPVGLPSPYVSEPHATLTPVPEGWRITDAASSNHTYVGTVRIQEQTLIYGDEVRVGDVVLLFVTADRPALPPHTLDSASGLLGRQVLMAEASQRPVSDTTGLLLLKLCGLRALAAEGKEGPLVRRTGELLLRRFEDALIGRLEADLFVVVLGQSDRVSLRRQGEALLEQLAAGCAPDGPRGRVVLLLGDGPGQRFPQLLACARAELERAPGGPDLVEAEPSAGALVSDRALLEAILEHPDRPLLVLTIEDEDRLLHHLGHDRLAAWRWLLRRAVLRVAAETGSPLVGVLDQRLFVVGLTDEAQAMELSERVARALEASPDEPAPALRWAAQRPGDAPPGRRALHRALLRAAEGDTARLPRESVEALPTPIAAPYGLVWVVSSGTARVKTILDSVEVLTRFAAVASLAAIVEAPTRQAPAARALAARRHRRLPLGEWVALLRELAPALPDDGVCGVLRRSLGVDARGVRFLALLERELLPRRNRFTHGELAADELQRSEQAAELLQQLNLLLRGLAPLGELQLFTVLRSDPRRSGGARAEVRVHCGARESFEVRQVDVRDPRPLFSGSCYLGTLDYRALVELSPLLRLARCPRCDREELFLADNLAGSGATLELSAVSTGHRLRWTPGEDDLPAGLRTVLDHG